MTIGKISTLCISVLCWKCQISLTVTLIDISMLCVTLAKIKMVMQKVSVYNNMASTIARIVKIATDTFANEISNSKHLTTLLPLVKSIKYLDLNFDLNLVDDAFMTRRTSAPISYVHISENFAVSCGIFVLRKNAHMPIHDHPKMHGIIKVIHGKIVVTSYTVRASDDLTGNERLFLIQEARKRYAQPIPNPIILSVNSVEERIVDVEDEACVLTPSEGNVHKIFPFNGAAAFLDILAPPYDHINGSRVCHYFYELCLDAVLSNRSDSKLRYLIEIGQPRDYRVESAPYTGPDVDSH